MVLGDDLELSVLEFHLAYDPEFSSLCLVPVLAGLASVEKPEIMLWVSSWIHLGLDPEIRVVTTL